LALLLQQIVESSQREEGCLGYDLLMNEHDKSEFVFLEEWESKEAFDREAKRALRLHRKAEARRLPDQIENDARAAVLELLSSNGLRGRQAEALRLYAGIDNGKWRTYDEVGHLMNLSKERVRQLLRPAKLTLSLTLSDRVPWRPLERNGSNREDKKDISQSIACALCDNIALKALDHEFYLYENCGLPNVVLSGLPIEHCQDCNAETVSIPRIPDLHRELARAVLLKPAALTGKELRFLRTLVALSVVTFAEQLGVAIQTIKAWERCATLRYLNDMGARIVVASLIALDADFCSVSRMLGSIRARRSEPVRVSAFWSIEKAKWVVTTAAASDQRPP